LQQKSNEVSLVTISTDTFPNVMRKSKVPEMASERIGSEENNPWCDRQTLLTDYLRREALENNASPDPYEFSFID